MSTPRRAQLPIILPLLAGIALVFAIPHLRPLIDLEHRFFLIPSSQELALEREPLEEFCISAYPIVPSGRIAGKNLLNPDDHSVTDWMLSLHTLRANGVEHITISRQLSWSEADELELRALEHEVLNFPTATHGYDLQLGSTPQPFPEHLSDSQIDKITGKVSLIPEVNALSTSPSITSGRHGFRLMENAQPQITANTIRIPLLARWGERILPSLELASLIARSGVSPSEVEVHLGSHIRIPNRGPIIPIDDSGNTEVSREKKLTKKPFCDHLDSKSTPTRIVVSAQDDPPHLQQLGASLAQLSGGHEEAVIYKRLPFWIEIPILILLSLLLAIKTRLAILLLPLPFLLSHFYNYWHLWTPALVLVAGFFLLRIIPKNKDNKSPDHQ